VERLTDLDYIKVDLNDKRMYKQRDEYMRQCGIEKRNPSPGGQKLTP
jgi:hypothetical protein